MTETTIKDETLRLVLATGVGAYLVERIRERVIANAVIGVVWSGLAVYWWFGMELAPAWLKASIGIPLFCAPIAALPVVRNLWKSKQMFADFVDNDAFLRKYGRAAGPDPADARKLATLDRTVGILVITALSLALVASVMAGHLGEPSDLRVCYRAQQGDANFVSWIAYAGWDQGYCAEVLSKLGK